MKPILPTVVLTVILSALQAHASTTLQCTFFANRGTATIEVLPTKDHPELAVLKIDMRPELQNGTGHVSGLLSASFGANGSVFAYGLVETVPGNEPILNPESITLQGYANPDGTLGLQLYDEDRILQHGFGIPFSCK